MTASLFHPLLTPSVWLLLAECYFALGTITCCVSYYSSTLQKLSVHGRGLVRDKSCAGFFYLSKNYFVLFYVLAFALGAAAMWLLPFSILRAVFFIHIVRRLLETRYLFRSTSMMNLIHFAIGLSFYPM
ncbi:hypothetical protein HDU91_006625, partial [Kappamyces sp. JEL0680]